MQFIFGIVIIVLFLFVFFLYSIPLLFIEIYHSSIGIIKLRKADAFKERDFTIYRNNVIITRTKNTYYDSYYYREYNGIEFIFENRNNRSVKLQFFSGTFFGYEIKPSSQYFDIILKPGEMKKYQSTFTDEDHDRVKITIL
ncbi:MAG: hypothetical protein RM368_14735 [Nostoc sp. DedSLP03]|uniref:hypothetical protein n=1 Tax=Nostoc sp. DedSLP03 TaxID=3075400 RepID=UPI002AD50D18|nr:hypothetical protein [Nostoc sp. DedSLP03]MDZ7966209.1 hypothetical protein [Nostoc sp. DedSLP03]